MKIPYWHRHDLTHLRPGVRLPGTPAGRWLAMGGVGVVCRNETTARVRLGVCLPEREPGPGGKPPRGACEVSPGTLALVCPPFELTETLRSAPPAWRDGLEALVARGAAIGVHWQVFGSLSWRQLHGGHGFVNGDSDADLLFTPANVTQLDAALDLLGRFPGPPRLDGEVVFPGNLGVSWRELAGGGAARVLVKRLDGVELRETAALRALLPP